MPIDRLVTEGVGENRSDVIRQAIEKLGEAVRRARVGQTIADSYRDLPQSPDDDALAIANAIAMTEADTPRDPCGSEGSGHDLVICSDGLMPFTTPVSAA